MCPNIFTQSTNKTHSKSNFPRTPKEGSRDWTPSLRQFKFLNVLAPEPAWQCLKTWGSRSLLLFKFLNTMPALALVSVGQQIANGELAQLLKVQYFERNAPSQLWHLCLLDNRCWRRARSALVRVKFLIKSLQFNKTSCGSNVRRTAIDN